MKTIRNIAFAGWSSGGHVVPISTIIQTIVTSYQLPATSYQLFWFGERNSLEEKEAVKLQSSIAPKLRFVPITSWRMRRKPDIRELFLNIIDLFKLVWWIILSFYNLKKHHIDVIFCKGGFVSLPVVIAWWLARVRIVAHESDSKPGISTRVAAKFANKVFTGFPNVVAWGEYVGQILSEDLLPKDSYQLPAPPLAQWTTSYQSIDATGNGQQVTGNILVNCGSLGSASVHGILLKLFSDYPSLTKDFRWTILLGNLNIGFKVDYKKYPDIIVYEYIDQSTMGQLYRETDISICRGGSTSLVEQHIFGIKQIIVPIPWTHDQFTNAAFFVKEYGDVVIDQNQPNWGEQLFESLQSLKDYKKQDLDREIIRQQLQSWKERIIREILGS